MVPDCFVCANPCGRTRAYDLDQLEQEQPEIREAKYRILEKLRLLAENKLDSAQELLLYRGLVTLGLEGYTPEELYAVFSTDQI